jgi:hypothetical protein
MMKIKLSIDILLVTLAAWLVVACDGDADLVQTNSGSDSDTDTDTDTDTDSDTDTDTDSDTDSSDVNDSDTDSGPSAADIKDCKEICTMSNKCIGEATIGYSLQECNDGCEEGGGPREQYGDQYDCVVACSSTSECILWSLCILNCSGD